MISHIVWRLRGSRPVVGSSRKMIRGSPTRRHREVEPAAHAAGVGRGRARRRVDQVEAVEQLRGAPAALRAAEVVQVGHQDQVLLAREQVVDGRELAGDADRGAHRVGILGPRSWPATRSSPASAPIRVERIWTIVVLPAPLGPSSAKIGALGDVEVDAVEHDVVAEGLAQAGGGDAPVSDVIRAAGSRCRRPRCARAPRRSRPTARARRRRSSALCTLARRWR